MNRLTAYTLVVVVLALAVIGAAAFLGNGSKAALIAMDNVAVSPQFLQQLVPSDFVFANVGEGSANNMPRAINGEPLLMNGKPTLIYIGADYCPYCAAERWELVIALMRFGNFTRLHYMTSSASDYAPSTATFTFYNSTYTSAYINFIGIELTTNKLVNGSYPPLQSMNSLESSLMNKYDPSGSIPFLYFGGYSVQIGSNCDPTMLSGLNWSQIEAELSNPGSTVAQGIIGGANIETAQICRMINNTAPVCNQQYIRRIEGS
ncbi:MAG: DUF929 family protein [Candidatus Micrarchaeaceae archaeon]